MREWLALRPLSEVDDSLLAQRTAELMALGFKNFDAFHLASSELMSADVFVTCDDRLLVAARRHATVLKVRVIDPVALLRELFP